MDIEKEYSCLEQNKRILQKCVDIDENYQETLQAYCDDLYRIIKCTAHSYVTSVDINYNEIKIFGKTEICVAYYDESSNLCYADFDEEFSKSVEAEGLTDSAFASAVACDKYCSFRVINQRRIDVHCSFSVNVCVYDKESHPCISACEASKLKCESIKSADVVGTCISKIEFDEELELGSSQVKRIINANCNVFLDEAKLIKDKALIKLSACVKILYCVDSNDEKIERYEHSFTCSKIIDVNSIDDNSIAIVYANAGSLYSKIKNSSSSDNCVVQLYGDLVINAVFINESEKEIVTDGYILNHNSVCDYSSYQCSLCGKYINEEKQQTVSLNFNNDIKEIYDLFVQIDDVAVKNGKLAGRAVATVICKTTAGDLTSFNTSVDVDFGSVDYDCATACALVKGYDYNLMSNGKIDVRLTYVLNGYMFNERSISVLSELDGDDEETSYPALTVYFGKKGEEVWNIAKSFSSDIDLIKKENELSCDFLDSNKILIIPGL